MTLSIKEIGAIAPIGFFHLTFQLTRTLKELPETSFLLGETSFAKVKMGYDEMGLQVCISMKSLFQEKDRIHLFVDTRDVKEKGIPHRYCHHFLISREGGEEITHFRGEEVRKIAEPFSVLCKGKSIEVELNDLYGFNPNECHRIGFTYLIELENGQKQHFAISSKDYTIKQHPDLWATGVLI
ncbi:MAG: hypothetical protein KBC64_04750 [Simkaniaceae bacterium]|nr:hypothetical protein [Simkaniaceae bacterium]